MVTKLLKVVSKTEPVYVQSKKQEGGQLAKSYVRLKELGGDFTDEYYCAAFGETATQKLEQNELVVVALRFQTHEVNGAIYQDVVAQEILKVNDVKAF